MTSVQWRPIPGYSGYYEVSNTGLVRSLKRTITYRTGARRTLPAADMNQRLDRKGYCLVSLRRDGVQITRKVHRLVLEAFVSPCPAGMVACHNDGVPTNNHVDNLRWDSFSNNNRDLVVHGTHVQARKTECPAHHPYDEQNTMRIRGGKARRCRTCHNAVRRQRRTRRAAA